MPKKKQSELFVKYFDKWIKSTKVGTIREVTLVKWNQTLRFIQSEWPDMQIKDIGRAEFQALINKYAQTHSKATTKDFYNQAKAPFEDLVYEGYIKRNPVHKIMIPDGVQKKSKRSKYLEIDEVKRLSKVLKQDDGTVSNLCLILLHTGMRFAESLAITPNDLDFETHKMRINKSWNYKDKGGFQPTKNASSVRTISIDSECEKAFKHNMPGCRPDEAIFGNLRTWYSTTINDDLKKLCKIAGVPVVTAHSLRHTHASVLIANGVSLQNVSSRLGHHSTTTTQEVYVHELEKARKQDETKIMNLMMSL